MRFTTGELVANVHEMDQLRALVASRDFSSLIAQLESLEQSHHLADAIHSYLAAQPARPPPPPTHAFHSPAIPPVSPHLICSLLVLAHAAIDDLPGARFVLKRAPESVLNHPLVQAVEPLFSSLWHRETPLFWEMVARVPYLSGEGEATDPELSLTAELASQLTERVRERAKRLIVKAYVAIRVPDATAMLGLDSTHTTELLANEGWTVQDGFFVMPEKNISSKRENGGSAALNGNVTGGLVGAGQSSQLDAKKARELTLEKMKAIAEMALRLEM
ncbi:hypothetical protein HDU93_008547 [Gonapodya sp. JEL0774]|nr:hypothetical protein HDU93_008547 [Gonapodya sp. JEL0774]